MPDIDALMRVNLVELKKLTDDLVKLETVNDPFINHNLRERCKIDNIYVCLIIIINNNSTHNAPIHLRVFRVCPAKHNRRGSEIS